MALDIKFSFVCEKRFEELKGQSNQTRFCEACQFQVFNLDPLTDKERLELFEDASKNSKKICISATIPIENKTPCPTTSQRLKPPIHPIRTAGLPVMPSPQKLAEERARIDALTQQTKVEMGKKQSWWEKLKFW